MIKNAQLVINKTFLVISKIREYNIFKKKILNIMNSLNI